MSLAFGERRAADDQRSRAVGAHAELHAVGIAEHDVDVIEGDAELLRHDLREGGLVPLPVIVGADQHRHLSGRMHADGGAFVEAATGAETSGKARRCEAAGFDVGRIAEAAELAVTFRRRLAFREARDIRRRKRAFESSPSDRRNHIRRGQASDTDRLPWR